MTLSISFKTAQTDTALQQIFFAFSDSLKAQYHYLFQILKTSLRFQFTKHPS